MSDEETYKITYHLGSQKKIKYFSKYKTFWNLSSYISKWLFEEISLPVFKIRMFWIDEENDEVDISTVEDYSFFYNNYPGRSKKFWHIYVANFDDQTDKGDTKNATSNNTSNQPGVPPADGSYDFAVHDNVECDECLMAPIVGFRYKCIQCPNYDLCQNCESKHVHSEHMMVRMPTNNCPSVVEAYITGRSSGRKHGKRSKNACPFVKNGLSVIVDDNSGENLNAGSGENSETSNGKERPHGRRHHRRHQRNNFLAHLYEMMHDLAEGGGAAAAAYATGEEASSSSKTTTAASTSNVKSSTSSAYSKDFGKTENGANIVAAQLAAQQAHESAVKAAEIASKVAHETALQAAKNISESVFAPTAPSSAQTDSNVKEKEATTKDKVDATTSPRDGPNTVSVSPSLETLAQFLDPQYMRTGIQILNNFSDMFAKMLDPMDSEEVSSNRSASACPFNTNLGKNSTRSTNSSVSSNLSDKDVMVTDPEKEKPIEKQENNEEAHKEIAQPASEVLSNVEIEDIGSDSENESVSDSFIKVDAPIDANATESTTANTSAQTTPPQSLNKSNVMDFKRLSANLKAHIAEEAAKSVSTSVETGIVATEQMTNSTNTNTANDERRAVPVFHADEKINSAVHAMMAMGFSNEGAWLTQLLESVNGNIPLALDLMTEAQKGGR